MLSHTLLTRVSDGFQFPVFPPPLLKAIRLREKHRILLGLVKQHQNWWEHKLDAVFFEHYQTLYIEIWLEVASDAAIHDLDPAERHRFFIGGDLISHEDAQVPDLSLLEQLMGYTYQSPSKDHSEVGHYEPTITTGNHTLDVLGGVLHVFPESAEWLANTFGEIILRQLINHAADLADPDEAKKRLQTEHDMKLFELHQDEINKAFNAARASIGEAYLLEAARRKAEGEPQSSEANSGD